MVSLDNCFCDFSLVKDYVIKEILTKNKEIYKEIVIMLINDVIKLDINDTNILFENVELGKSNYNEYNKIIDNYIKINDVIHVDIEFNTSLYNTVKLRNLLYLNKISTKILESGDKINKLNDVYLIQININSSLYDNKFGYEIYELFGKKTCNKLTDFEHILVYNIEYYRNLFYNEGASLKKYEMWLVVFSSRCFKELYNTLNYVVKPKIRNKIIKEVIDMFSDGFSLYEWKQQYAEQLKEFDRLSILESERMAKEQARKEGLLEGRQEGILEGKKEGVLLTIKSMLEKNYSLTEISDITGKNLKEIKEIKDSMI